MFETPRDLIDATIAALRPAVVHIERRPFVAGLDGFVDYICKVVSKRRGPGDAYDAMPTIEDFGQRVLEASGRSTSIEVVPEPPRLGGNGPLLARGLGRYGLPMTYIGAVGVPGELHPAFQALGQFGEVISLCEPAVTDAYEFHDGKIMMSKTATLDDVTPATIDRIVGRDRLGELLGRASLLALVNWTKVPATDEVWTYLLDEILPTVEWTQDLDRPIAFFDLADPVGRPREALQAALHIIARFQEHYRVIFGTNLKEGVQVAAALGKEGLDDAETIAATIREAMGIDEVVVHPVPCAAAATVEGARALVPGPHCGDPLTTTGGGDNFNAGYCFARVLGLEPAMALCIGKATSGYYVRSGISPTPEALIAFLQVWRDGKLSNRIAMG